MDKTWLDHIVAHGWVPVTGVMGWLEADMERLRIQAHDRVGEYRSLTNPNDHGRQWCVGKHVGNYAARLIMQKREQERSRS